MQAACFPAFLYRAAPGLVLGLPDDLALGVAQLFGQAYLIGVEVVHLAQIGVCAGAVGAGVRTGVLDCALWIECLPVARFY